MDNWLEYFARANFRRSGDTAHDLKTPLNVAVLNLELLRMRLAKLPDGADDEKIAAYMAAIETELRRLARIFDAFFILSTPPKGEGDPALIDISALAAEAARADGVALESKRAAIIRAHESRIRQALKWFFDGAERVFKREGRAVAIDADYERFELTMSGQTLTPDFESSKIFKFYYTDASGNPDLSLASTRLIIETYGGELNAAEERDKFVLRLSVPLGDQ
jgi:K+-sensing histidine kinase KdpD